MVKNQTLCNGIGCYNIRQINPLSTVQKPRNSMQGSSASQQPNIDKTMNVAMSLQNDRFDEATPASARPAKFHLSP